MYIYINFYLFIKKERSERTVKKLHIREKFGTKKRD